MHFWMKVILKMYQEECKNSVKLSETAHFWTLFSKLSVFIEKHISILFSSIVITFRAWISGRDSGICSQNLKITSKRIAMAGNSLPEKFSVFRKSLLLWNETPRSRKFADFRVTVDNFLSGHSNFLLPIGNSCCCCRVYGRLSHEGPRPVGGCPPWGSF